MALIECKIKRLNGSHSIMDGVRYDFKPDKKGRHVCQVDNPAHVARFLAISDSYEDLTPAAKNEPAAT
jgi:hypothetical protein